MVDSVLLYISAAFDLEGERAALARAIADIPVTLGWQIVQTPHIGESPDLETVSHADFHLLLIGSDIRAPVGFEWYVALQSGNRPVLYIKKNISRTPAAQVFIREVESRFKWHPYQDIPDLCYQVQSLLGDHLLEYSSRYELSAKEINVLKEWKSKLNMPARLSIEEHRGVTGESSILLSPERYIPSDGVLIQPPEDQET